MQLIEKKVKNGKYYVTYYYLVGSFVSEFLEKKAKKTKEGYLDVLKSKYKDLKIRFEKITPDVYEISFEFRKKYIRYLYFISTFIVCVLGIFAYHGMFDNYLYIFVFIFVISFYIGYYLCT